MLARLAAAFLACSLATGAATAAGFATRPPAASADTAEQAPSRAAVRSALAARRAHNLAAFRAYAKAGVYPHNFVRPGPLNVWRDADGHLCAAATMIDRDGKHDLVADTATKANHIRLLDVTDGALLDWMLTSGLTIEEIDRIQAPAMAPVEPQRDWRKDEDARLRVSYAATDRWLADHANAGLDTATDRLMASPVLAGRLLAGAL